MIHQDPAPLTEDVLEEQSKVMIELGDDAQVCFHTTIKI